MNINEVLTQLNCRAAMDEISPFWDESNAAMPAAGPDFLKPDVILANLEFCGFDPGMNQVVLSTAEKIGAHPALKQLAWHCFWRVFDAPQESYFGSWPALETILGEEAGIFYLLIGIGFVDKVKRHHAALGVPNAITRQTCQQPRSFCLNYQMMTGGRLGIPRSQLWWLRYYTCKPYFRLRRLEFWLNQYRDQYHVFRHQKSSATIVLAAEKQRFDQDGYPLEESAAEAGWSSSLKITTDEITGYPISPYGACLPAPVSLRTAEWAAILQPGDTILDLHIPAGGSMTPEACADSFQQAAALFPALFPDNPPRAVVCSSWIYSPYLEQILAPGSNLVRNAIEPYLVPVHSNASDGLWFIFYQDDFNRDTAPRQTSLQRTFWDYLNAGKPWRCGGMIMMLDDLPHYGSAIYRANWQVICKNLGI